MKHPSYLRRKWNRLMASIKAKLQEWKVYVSQRKYWSNAAQRHHDFYVFKARQGDLDQHDRLEYERAMAREKAGKVKPLPKNTTSTFG